MFTVPSWWRRAKFGSRLSSKQETGDDGSQSNQELSKTITSARAVPMSSALVNNDSTLKGDTQYGQYSKGVRSTGDLPTVNAMFKPLPRPPDSILRPAR